jgi:predicted aspartyl protease
MPAYDASLYDPPAPTIDVILRDAKSGATVSGVHLLIDTGADVSLIPQTAAEKLGIRPISGLQYELVGFDGAKSVAGAVELDLIFLQKAFRGRYLLSKSSHGVLGRDVLAGVVLIIDGPR